MENNQSLVSIIMSVYNSENTLEKCLESIVNQSYRNVELLLNDDSSTDNTYNICKSYSDKYENIKLYSNPTNQGLTYSLNKLLNLAQGALIARQDGDDFSDENRLELQIKYLQQKNLDACTTRAKVINSEKTIPGLKFYLPLNISMKYRNPFIHGTLLVKNRILKKLGGYDSRFKYSQDYKLMKDLIDQGYKISIMKQKLYNLNMEGNISSLNKVEQEYYAKCVRKNLSP